MLYFIRYISVRSQKIDMESYFYPIIHLMPCVHEAVSFMHYNVLQDSRGTQTILLSYRMAYAWRSLCEGVYTWNKTSVKEKEGTYLQGTGGGGL